MGFSVQDRAILTGLGFQDANGDGVVQSSELGTSDHQKAAFKRIKVLGGDTQALDRADLQILQRDKKKLANIIRAEDSFRGNIYTQPRSLEMGVSSMKSTAANSGMVKEEYSRLTTLMQLGLESLGFFEGQSISNYGSYGKITATAVSGLASVLGINSQGHQADATIFGALFLLLEHPAYEVISTLNNKAAATSGEIPFAHCKEDTKAAILAALKYTRPESFERNVTAGKLGLLTEMTDSYADTNVGAIFREIYGSTFVSKERLQDLARTVQTKIVENPE